MTGRLSLEDFSFGQLRDAELRRRLFEANRCGLMSQKLDDEHGTVEIIVRDRKFADAEKHYRRETTGA